MRRQNDDYYSWVSIGEHCHSVPFSLKNHCFWQIDDNQPENQPALGDEFNGIIMMLIRFAF